MNDVLFYQNYVIAGDVVAIVLCVVIHVLLHSSYAVKKRNLNIFRMMHLLIFMASISSIIYHKLLENLTSQRVLGVYFFRDITYIALIWIYVFFCIYIRNLIEMRPRYKKIFNVSIIGTAILYSVWMILTPVTKLGFYIDENLAVHQNYYLDMFRLAYVYYMVSIAVLLFAYRKKFIGKMLKCIVWNLFLSFSLMAFQDQFMQTTYICVNFLFPVITVLFLYHHNSYDVATGTLDHHAFDAYVVDMNQRKFSMIFLSIPDFTKEKLSGLAADFFRMNDKYLSYSCSFRLRDNKIVMAYPKDRNRDVEPLLSELYEEFKKTYEKKKLEYQIVLIDSSTELSNSKDYLELCDYLEKNMSMNTAYVCTPKNIRDFLKERHVLHELHDIYLCDDLNDERVRVFCQPVFNTKTNTFTTAEALMRLELHGLGMVFPDQFIPLAEEHGYIHVLSKIVLNKTCQHVKQMEKQGYSIERVSVNFSIQELHLENFCQDVVSIIEKNQIPFQKIAMELTESRNEKDFNNVKRIMESLQGLGIKFYLDDFGTGYSNFERIIGLPIDIIKFDRSMTILASKNDESRFMVGSFSEIFKKADYQILFEGVEDENDEMQCINMDALYLQGYKYSKPIPMVQLTEFLSKAS